VAEVDVEEASRVLLEHVVWGVSVPDADGVGGDALAGKWGHETLLVLF